MSDTFVRTDKAVCPYHDDERVNRQHSESMSLNAAQSGLTSAYKEFRRRWDRITEQWDDPVSREIESSFIDPLEPQIRQAVNGLSKMAESMQMAEREC